MNPRPRLWQTLLGEPSLPQPLRRLARWDLAVGVSLFLFATGCTTYKETVHVQAFIENVGVGLGREDQPQKKSYEEKPEPITPPRVQTL
jgi:hypothetical protein